MDPFQKHVLERLGNIEGELAELRTITWPVCQGLLDKNGPFENKKEKRSFFRFLFEEEGAKLIRLKNKFMGISPALASSELQWILVEVPSVDVESN